MKRAIIFSIIVVSVFLGLQALAFVNLTDQVTRHAPGTASDHLITFTSVSGVSEAGQTLTVAFPAGFDLSAVTAADIDLSHGATGVENEETLSGTATTTNWGVQISGQNIIFTHPTDGLNGDISAAEVVKVEIGTNAGGSNQIVNPGSEGSYIVRITSSVGEYGALAIPVTQDQVGVAGTIGAAMTATIQWAVPELRVGAPETNDDATFYLTVRTQTDADDTVLFTQPTLLSTDNDGTYLTSISLGSSLAPGTYDVGIKTNQHLTRILNDISLVAGNNTLNFSTTDNSPAKGSVRLLAGDISGAGTAPATLGDDVVNSVDLSKLLSEIDDDDPTGNAIRANLNQDIVVNSVDLSMLIKNLDLEGDN